MKELSFLFNIIPILGSGKMVKFTNMESTQTKMSNIKEIGKTISRMATEYKLGLIIVFIKESTVKGKNTAKEFINGMTNLNI